jgi:hypothetical protein
MWKMLRMGEGEEGETGEEVKEREGGTMRIMRRREEGEGGE